MQRMVESIVILPILEKYEKRYKECSEQWDNDMAELKSIEEEQKTRVGLQCMDVGLQCTNIERKDFLLNDILALNAQLSAYECIIKDLKGLIK